MFIAFQKVPPIAASPPTSPPHPSLLAPLLHRENREHTGAGYEWLQQIPRLDRNGTSPMDPPAPDRAGNLGLSRIRAALQSFPNRRRQLFQFEAGSIGQ